MDGLFEHLQAVFEVDGPERLAPFGERVAAPDVVNQDVEAFVLALDAGCEFLNFGRDSVIDSDGMPWPPAAVTSSAVSSMVSGGGTFLVKVFSNFFSNCGRCSRPSLRPRRGDGDAASGAASGSGDQDDLPCRDLFGNLLASLFGTLLNTLAICIHRRT